MNASPSFLQLNKQKHIVLSTLTNKMTEWRRDMCTARDSHVMGDEAFYNLASHPESMKLTIQIVRMQVRVDVVELLGA